MKKLVIAFVFFGCALVVYSAPPVAEAPIKGFGTPVTIAISSTALTLVPNAQMSGRAGIFIHNPKTNSGDVTGFFGSCVSNSIASTIRPIIVSTNPASNFRYFPIREDVCMYLINTNTLAASENIHYQEVQQ